MTIKAVLLTKQQVGKLKEISGRHGVEIVRVERKDENFSAVTIKGHDSDVKSCLNVL